MVLPLPQQIVICDELLVTVVEKSLEGQLGSFDPNTLTIYIEKDQDETGKHLILIHELMHLAEEGILQKRLLGRWTWLYKLLRRSMGEALITNMAGLLFQFMGRAGMLTAVTPAETEKFANEMEEV